MPTPAMPAAASGNCDPANAPNAESARVAPAIVDAKRVASGVIREEREREPVVAPCCCSFAFTIEEPNALYCLSNRSKTC